MEQSWTRGQKWALAVLIVGACLCLFWTVHPYYDHSNDAAIYIVSARNMLAGEGYSFLGIPVIVRPPGLSALLVPLLALFGMKFWVLNLLIGLFGVLCIPLIFIVYRNRLGAALAFATCAVIWLNPSYQRLCSQVLSDIPGAALMFLCLMLDHWSKRVPSARRHILLGVCIAGAMYMRTMNALLVPAIILSRFVQRLRKKTGESVKPFLCNLGLVVIIPAFAYLPWVLRNARCDVPVPTDQIYLHSYWTAMVHTDPGDPNSPKITLSDFLARIPAQLKEVLPLLGNRFKDGDFSGIHYVFAVFAILCWLAVLAGKLRSTEFFGGLIFVVLATYFSFRPRLVLPVYLFFFPATVQALLWVASRAFGMKAGQIILTVGILLLGVVDFDRWSWQALIEKNYRELNNVCEYIEQHFPGDGPLAAANGRHYTLMLNRPVYSLGLIFERKGVKEALDFTVKHRVAAVIGYNEPGTVEKKHLGILIKNFPLVKRIKEYFIFRGPEPTKKQRP